MPCPGRPWSTTCRPATTASHSVHRRCRSRLGRDEADRPRSTRPAFNGPVVRSAVEVASFAGLDVTATALARALCRHWDRPEVTIDLEGHGRPDDEDLSRTVGWFTEIAPVTLPALPGEAPLRALERIRGILDLPRSHGPKGEVVLNHLGRTVPPPREGWRHEPAKWPNRAARPAPVPDRGQLPPGRRPPLHLDRRLGSR